MTVSSTSRLFSFTITVVLLLFGFVLLITLPDESSPLGAVSAGVDPSKDTYVWDGEGGDTSATTAANWYKIAVNGTITNDIAPVADSNLVWNGTSTKACSFNIDDGTAVFYSFNIQSGYSGTITQASTADIGVGLGGYSQTAGTLTGNTNRYVECSGSFLQTGGELTTAVLNVVMTGSGVTYTTNTGNQVKTLTINGTTTYTPSAAYSTIRNLDINPGATLTIANGKYLIKAHYNTYTFSNDGTIQGAGTGYLLIRMYDADMSITPGTIYCPMVCTLFSSSTASRNLTLGADTSLGSSLTIKSDHASYTLTLDASGSDLTATAITVGTRGVLLGGEGDITTASWDSSAGTWTPETSNVHFTGTGTVKTASGQTFYNLIVSAGASVTQSSNVVVSEWMELDGGAWTKGAYTLTAPLMTISSSITATGTEDATYSYTPTADQPISSISVVTNGTWLSIVGTSVVGTPTNAEVGTFYVNVTCTNVIGSVSQNSTITISNTAPVWTTAPSTEWSYGMTYSYDPSASDEGAGLTYSMTSSAIELRCDPTSGAIRGKVLDNSITVSLMADDGHGGVIWQNWTITAMGFSWDGDVLVNYTEGQNLKVTFNASLTNATYNAIIKSVQWNFGDGNGSRVLDLAPMHPYERPGTYMVTCYIVTEDDMTATKTFQITVGDPAVVEDLEAQYAERVNQAILISGLVCAFGLVLIACYIKVAGRRGWINRLVPIMILIAMLAISATLIGSAMQ